MELFVNSHEPKVNLSVKCKASVKETFQRLCKETNLNQADFLESAIMLLDNPTSTNWRKWQKIYQERNVADRIADQSDPFYNPANQERLKRSIAQMEATGGTVHELPEVDDND